MEDLTDLLLTLSEGTMKRVTELQKHLNDSKIPEVKQHFADRIANLLDIVSVIQYTISKEIKHDYSSKANTSRQPAQTSNQPTSSSSSSITS